MPSLEPVENEVLFRPESLVGILETFPKNIVPFGNDEPILGTGFPDAGPRRDERPNLGNSHRIARGWESLGRRNCNVERAFPAASSRRH